MLYQSDDGGQTWATVPYELPISELAVIDSSHAVALVSDAGCRQFKSDCYEYRYLVATDDAGRTWHTI
jgi:photosystem II stability/assembly factor-like uncharacterized protein